MQYFVPFLVVLFVIAALLHIDFFFTIVYLFFAVYVASRVWMQHSVANVRVRRKYVNRAFPGDQVSVRVLVSNASWLPVPWLEVHESLPVRLATPPHHRQVLSLRPREQVALAYTLHCQRRGYYPIGPLTMRTGDLLGLLQPRQIEAASDHMIVYPRVVSLDKLGLPTRAPQVSLLARTALFEDPARVMGVRDYQRGDSPRRIHWTATASSGRLLVKQYQRSIARESLICLDLDHHDYGQRQRYTATELAIVAAASMANHIITRERLPAGLATEAWDPLVDRQVRFILPPHSQRAQLMGLLEVLARVETTSDTSFIDLLRRATLKLSWGATVVAITGSATEALYDTLAYLRRAGFAVALLLVQPGRLSSDLSARSDQMGVRVQRVWKEEDLEAWA
jgi:uncharacterized protein (DUF58 family)